MSIRRGTRRNPRPCVWTADVRVSDVVWKYLRDDPADPGRDLFCRLGGDPSLPRSSDCIASYIPTGLLQHEYSSSRKFSVDFMITHIENFLMERKYCGFRIKAIELISVNIR